jgi:hypothetical protein
LLGLRPHVVSWEELALVVVRLDPAPLSIRELCCTVVLALPP